MKSWSKLVMLVTGLLYTVAATASAPLPGIGGVAQSMLDPVGLFSSFTNAGCIIIGGSFVFASIVKYTEHRRSPLNVPMSTVVFLFLAGSFLLILPFFSYFYTEAMGIKFTK